MTSLQKEGYQIHKLKNPDAITEFQNSIAGIDFAFANNVNRELCNYDTSLFERDVAKKRSCSTRLTGYLKAN